MKRLITILLLLVSIAASSQHIRHNQLRPLTNEQSDSLMFLLPNGFFGYYGIGDILLTRFDSTGFRITESQISNLQHFTNADETDPIFNAHTTSNIINGTGFLKNNGAGAWSYDNNTYYLDSNPDGYISGYTETDPVFNSHVASSITTTDTSNWNAAYSWGDHAAVGYMEDWRLFIPDVPDNFFVTNQETVTLRSDGAINLSTNTGQEVVFEFDINKMPLDNTMNAAPYFAIYNATDGNIKTEIGAFDAGYFGSGAATDGYVLTADGFGNTAWEAGTTSNWVDVEANSYITGRAAIGKSTFTGSVDLSVNSGIAVSNDDITISNGSLQNTGALGGKIQLKSSNYTCTNDDHTIVATNSGITISLPSSTRVNQYIVIVNRSGGAITTSSYEAIDGTTKTNIPANTSVTLHYYQPNLNWYQIN